MSDGNVRILRDIVLDVVMDGKTQPVMFERGCFYPVIKVEKDNGYFNLYFTNGTVAKGVAGEVFTNCGYVPVTRVKADETVAMIPTLKLKPVEPPVEPTEPGTQKGTVISG